MAKDNNVSNADKLKALQMTMERLDKTYGKGTVMRLGDNPVVEVESISSGSLTLDLALGIHGYPKGRIIEIYGPESSGKTTLAIHAMAQVQKAGGIAAMIDAEHAFDRFYAEKLGVETESLLISQPDNGEQALEIADHLISSGAVDLVVIDSVAALTPKAEIEGDMGDSKMGLQARLMSQALRKLTSTINKSGSCVIFINQLRDKIGVMFGNPETTTGGNALKFYASVRLDIRKVSQIKDGEDVLGNRVRVKVIKNKMAPPFKKAEFDILFGEGISKAGEIIDLGVELEIIKKSGSWFSYGDTKLGQGRDAVKDLVRDNEELSNEIEAKIIEALKELPKGKFQLFIVGNRDYDFGEHHVVKTGYISSELEMRAAYAAADAYLLPSREDNLPNVMLEAFAQGVPVISFKNGGMADWISDGFNGYLCKDIDASALAQQINKFMLERDRFNREQINAFALKHFSPEQQSSAYEFLYQNLIKES